MTQFSQNHKLLMDYINQLEEARFLYSNNGRWTAGQQLSHIVLCLKPIESAIRSKVFIEEKFGHIDHAPMDYESVIQAYQAALERGGKAPGRFEPAEVSLADKVALMNELEVILASIQKQWETYSDVELNSLALPHPLLGKLSIRELFCLMSFHAIHHLEQTKKNAAHMQP